MPAKSIKYDEATLVDLLKKQDRKGFEYLYAHYSGALYNVIMQMTQNNEEVASDILQESFVKIWRNFASYDENKARLYTWMLNITRNACIDALRNKHLRHSALIYSVDNVVDNINRVQSVKPINDDVGINDVLMKLKPEQRQLVDLFYYKGYTHEEIAEALNTPLGTVKSRIRAALLVLREHLSKN